VAKPGGSVTSTPLSENPHESTLVARIIAVWMLGPPGFVGCRSTVRSSPSAAREKTGLRLTRLPIVTRGRQGGAELIYHDVEVIEKGVDGRDPAVSMWK
jgi:hypothetical protein